MSGGLALRDLFAYGLEWVTLRFAVLPVAHRSILPMKTCCKCDREFPDDLVQDMAMTSSRGLVYLPVDAVCALKIRNDGLGLPPETPFHGPGALALHKRTVQYLKEHYDDK